MGITHIFKKFSNENKGVTLVEVIVSLLILSIIIVPLLSGFVTAGKANQVTKDSIYAKNVGESVIESVKLLGIEGTAMEFYKDRSSGNGFLFAADCESFEEIIDEDGHASVVESEGVKSFSRQASGKYEYMIKGIKQGTNTYDVILELDNSSYKNEEYNYKYADLSPYNSESSAVINPVLSGSDYDYRAFQYFKNLNERYTYSEYVESRERVEERNALLWEKYYEDLEKYNDDLTAGLSPQKPEEPVTEPIPDKKPLLSDEYIKRNISKTVEISIKEENGLSGTDYIVNSTITYECDNSDRQYAQSGDVISKTYSGYCTDEHYSDITSLILLYKPFGSAEELNREQVAIKKETSAYIDVYVVVQAEGETDYTKSKLNVSVDTSDIGKIKLFSQAQLDITPANIRYENKLINDMSAENSIYNITAKVYRGGGTFEKCITTIDSTLIDK